MLRMITASASKRDAFDRLAVWFARMPGGSPGACRKFALALTKTKSQFHTKGSRFGRAEGKDLNELFVSAGLPRIYGTRTPLSDGRDSREYLAHLHELENEAKAEKRGAWSKVQP